MRALLPLLPVVLLISPACIGTAAVTTDAEGLQDAGVDATTDTSSPSDAGTATDGGLSTDATADAPSTDAGVSDAGPCNTVAEFGAPVPIPGLGPQIHVNGVRYSPSGTELLISREDVGTPKKQQVHTFKFANGAWSETLQVAFNTPNNNTDGEINVTSPSFASDVRAFFTAFTSNGRYYALQRIERTNPTAAWGSPSQIFAPGKASYSVEYPFYHAPTATLYYMSPTTGTLRYTLYSATYQTNQLTNITPITFSGVGNGEYAPVVSEDGLTMYFASSVAEGRRIYRATRANTATPWGGVATEVTVLNGVSATLNHPSWISKDGCEIIVTQDSNVLVARKPH